MVSSPSERFQNDDTARAAIELVDQKSTEKGGMKNIQDKACHFFFLQLSILLLIMDFRRLEV